MGLKFEIERDGETKTVEIDLSLDPRTFTLQELRRIEKVCGPEVTTDMIEGRPVHLTAEILTAIVWTQLYSVVPGISMDEVDIPVADIGRASHPDAVDLPMETPDGDTDVGSSDEGVPAVGNG